jgi:putative membrane protein
MEMYWYGPHMGGWGWALGLSSLMFWVLLAVVIIALVRFFTRGGQRSLPPYQSYASGPGPHVQPGPTGDHSAVTPEQVLAKRFARGEIDEEEFRQRMAALRTHAQPPGSAATPS